MSSLHKPHNEMPKEMKAKWIEALRSGKYKQGKGLLYNDRDNSYCCLGVLQHCIDGDVEKSIFGANAVPSMEWLEKNNIKFFFSEYNQCEVPTFKIKNKTHNAATLNDVMGYSFNDIADLIETQVKGV